MKIGRIVIPILLAFLVYIVYTGALTLYDLITGIIAASIIGIIVGPRIIEKWEKTVDIRRWITLIIYAIRYALIDEIRAHLLVIRLGLSPSMPIRPAIVRIPLKSRSEYAQTLVAISITNTPGTVVVDADRDRGIFYVHWIYAKDLTVEGAYKEVAEVFDRYAKKIFD